MLSTPTSGLPIDLRKEIPTVELELPGIEELRVVLNDASKALEVRASEDDESLLDAARGLTVMEARLAFGQAAAALDRLDHSAVPLVATGYQAIVSTCDRSKYGSEWLTKLNACYQVQWTAKQKRLAAEECRRLEEERQRLVETQRMAIHERAKNLGYMVKETREEDTIRIALVKRTY